MDCRSTSFKQLTCQDPGLTSQAYITHGQKEILPCGMWIRVPEHHSGPRGMGRSEGTAGAGAVVVVAGQAGVPGAVAAEAFSTVLAMPEPHPLSLDSCMPGMWHDWPLDLKQIMNPHQVPVMISAQDEDELNNMMDLRAGRELQGRWVVVVEEQEKMSAQERDEVPEEQGQEHPGLGPLGTSPHRRCWGLWRLGKWS